MLKKYQYVILFVTLFISSLTFGQQITEAEYFWDTDPGLGNGTVILAEDGALDEAVENLFSNSVSLPAPGIHTFNIRVKGLDNTWSSTFSYSVNLYNSVLQSRNIKVIQAEYFWDTDPGQGSASPILALDGNLDEAVEQVFDNPSSLPATGLHTFNLRVRGADSTWSNVFTHAVSIGNSGVVSRDVKVIQAEYFWDTDPGQGNGTVILALDGNLDEAVESLFNGSLPAPVAGLHTFNLRVQGFDNTWSSVFSYAINVAPQTTLTRSVNVVQAEYFWDTDPGLGNGTVILALDGNLDEAVEQLFDGSLPPPAAGLHTFNLRVQGFDNTWSSVFSYAINVTPQTILTRSINVVEAEYFWDTDPGVGNGTPIFALDGNLDEAVEDLFATSLTPSIVGPHLFNLRVKGVDNGWSTPFQHVVNILDSNTYATIDPVICDGSTYTVPSGDETYSVAGTYTDTLINANGYDSLITINLTINPITTSTISPAVCGSYISPAGNTYTSSGTYTETIPNAAGCDSIITINLTILPSTFAMVNQSACDSYVSPSGNYVWNSTGIYTDTIPNAAGCDSIITVNLVINTATSSSVNATACDQYFWPVDGNTYTTGGAYFATIPNVSGCDSLVTLNLTIKSSSASTENVAACSSYTWPTNGQTYTTSGVYTEVLTNSGGCDSTVTLNLNLGNDYIDTAVVSACDDYLWAANGMTYTTSGFYTVPFVTAQGCDSTLNLDLTVNTSTTATVTLTDCDLYTWPVNGNSYTSSGTYTATIPNAAGCDSIVTLNLTIVNSTSSTEVVSACANYFWPASGQTYTASGTYTTVIPNAVGCDSSMTLNLTVNNGFANTASIGACGSYTWSVNGTTYTNSGVYNANFVDVNGCDSTYTLNLTIGVQTSSSSSIAACESYFWPVDGQTYTNSGTYTSTMPNASGCDSLITLNLTISGATNSSETIAACNSYFWSATGQTYTSSGTYSATLLSQQGCDSTVNLDLTISTVNAQIFQTDNILTSSNAGGGTYEWIDCTTGAPIIGETGQEFIATTNGDYAVVITLDGCSDTSSCVTVDNANIDQLFLESISLYPNPTNGKITIDFGEFKDFVSITLRDAGGRLLQTTEYENVDSLDMTIEYPTGVYFIEISSNEENAVLRVLMN